MTTNRHVDHCTDEDCPICESYHNDPEVGDDGGDSG